MSNESFDEIVPKLAVQVEVTENDSVITTNGDEPDLPRLPVPAVPHEFHLAEDFIGEAGMKRLKEGSTNGHRSVADRNYTGRHRQ